MDELQKLAGKVTKAKKVKINQQNYASCYQEICNAMFKMFTN